MEKTDIERIILENCTTEIFIESKPKASTNNDLNTGLKMAIMDELMDGNKITIVDVKGDEYQGLK